MTKGAGLFKNNELYSVGVSAPPDGTVKIFVRCAWWSLSFMEERKVYLTLEIPEDLFVD